MTAVRPVRPIRTDHGVWPADGSPLQRQARMRGRHFRFAATGLSIRRKSSASRERGLSLTAVLAPDLAAAAQYYPAIYWFSMLRVPDTGRFPGTGPDGNGVPDEFMTPEQWLDVIKTNGRGNCHQLGNYATRYVPRSIGQVPQPS